MTIRSQVSGWLCLASVLFSGGLLFAAGKPTISHAPSTTRVSTSAGDVDRIKIQARQAFFEGRYKAAASLFEQATKLQPDSSAAFEGLGRSYERLAEMAVLPGRLSVKARKNYQIALDLDPRNSEALQGLIELHTMPVGVCYGNLDEAALLVDQLNHIDPSLGELNRFRLEEAMRESHSPEMAARCGYQHIARAFEKAAGATKANQNVR